MKIYNGENTILGRLAAQAAKDALLGEEVKIINCEKMIISGPKAYTLLREKQKVDRGGHPNRSQNTSRMPERFVRRSIRGMLPWKSARGKDAFRKILCYVGTPAEFAGKELITLAKASQKKLPTLKYLSVGEICKSLGSKR